MPQLIFKINKAGERGRSRIEIILDNNGKKYKKTAGHTDNVLSALDKLLKSAKIKVESLKDIKIEAHKEAGLTSLRIIKSIAKALRFSLYPD